MSREPNDPDQPHAGSDAEKPADDATPAVDRDSGVHAVVQREAGAAPGTEGQEVSGKALVTGAAEETDDGSELDQRRPTDDADRTGGPDATDELASTSAEDEAPVASGIDAFHGVNPGAAQDLTDGANQTVDLVDIPEEDSETYPEPTDEEDHDADAEGVTAEGPDDRASEDRSPASTTASGDASADDEQEAVGQAASVEAERTEPPATDPGSGDRSSRKLRLVPPREPDEADLRLAEAMVFSSAEPVTARALSQVLAIDLDAEAVIEALRNRYAGRGVELVDAGGGVQFRTAPDLAPSLRKVIEVPRRLTRVAMETLAIVAYHQPVTRPEIEHLRGTSLSQQTLDQLLESNLIAPAGRKEAPGRPTLWATTPRFLTLFGLADLRALPRREDLLLEPMRPPEEPPA